MKRRCALCGGTHLVRDRGWNDEGVPMPTCASCEAPDPQVGLYLSSLRLGNEAARLPWWRLRERRAMRAESDRRLQASIDYGIARL